VIPNPMVLSYPCHVIGPIEKDYKILNAFSLFQKTKIKGSLKKKEKKKASFFS
jgi:hypothetical protein